MFNEDDNDDNDSEGTKDDSNTDRGVVSHTKRHLTYYYNEVRMNSLDLSKDAQNTLLVELQDCSDPARKQEILNTICKANLKLVYKIAKNYAHDNTSLENYISAGNEGLVVAVKKFKPGKAPFPNYAPYWIAQKILHEIYTNTLLKVPLWRIKSYIKIKLYTIDYKHANADASPSDEELAKTLKISKKNIQELRSDEYLTKILDRGLDDAEYPIQSILDDSVTKQIRLQVNLQKEFDTCDFPALINSAIGYLSVEQRFVVKAYYGLIDGTRKRLHEIAHVIDRTPERVRQIRNEAIEILRTVLVKAGFDPNIVLKD